MRCIIAGSRGITDPATLERALSECGFAGEITTVLSGGARGADTLGERWANERRIAVLCFPARWDLHGKAAGPRRNREMAEHCEPPHDALVALWDGMSRGTKDMIDVATKRGLRVYVHRTDTP